ncbi:chorismate mutase [Eubacteriaceae bacterium ES3]|nr:chorismate mutase [Eubacteriaceae bacterium ES3]
MSLESIRKKVDEIDDEMRVLFEKRMDCVREIIEYKYKHQENVFDPEREEQVLQANAEKLKNQEYRQAYEKVLKEMMASSKVFQKGWLAQKEAEN